MRFLLVQIGVLQAQGQFDGSVSQQCRNIKITFKILNVSNNFRVSFFT